MRSFHALCLSFYGYGLEPFRLGPHVRWAGVEGINCMYFMYDLMIIELIMYFS